MSGYSVANEGLILALEEWIGAYKAPSYAEDVLNEIDFLGRLFKTAEAAMLLAEQRARELEERLLADMQQEGTRTLAIGSWRISREVCPPKVELHCPIDELPEQFVRSRTRVEIRARLKEIKAAIEAGEPINWASIVQKERLVIKPVMS